MKLQTDIRYWETSKNLKTFIGLQNARHNKRTNQSILKKRTKRMWIKKIFDLEKGSGMEQISLYTDVSIHRRFYTSYL